VRLNQDRLVIPRVIPGIAVRKAVLVIVLIGAIFGLQREHCSSERSRSRRNRATCSRTRNEKLVLGMKPSALGGPTGNQKKIAEDRFH
jgi:hypothetical protein